MKQLLPRKTGSLHRKSVQKIIMGVKKFHDPEHAHILSGILRCPCCGKGMYGNIAKAGRKDNKTRYYYYCKNTVNAQMKLKPLWFGLFLILIET